MFSVVIEHRSFWGSKTESNHGQVEENRVPLVWMQNRGHCFYRNISVFYLI